MQKKIVSLTAAILCASAVPVMAQTATGGSKVQLWGIVDAAVRHTDNQGANRSGKTEMIGGGMSQSRWGIKVEEDLGNGTKALVELENRFTTDNGNTTPGGVPFFQLAHVGLQTPYGKLTMGRQWNVLFDVVTSTYASFPYSPYMEAYKPELGMAAGARSSNTLKYAIATPDRKFVGGLQYSFGEGAKVNPSGSAAALVGAGLNTTSAVTVGNTLAPALGSEAWSKHVSDQASALKQVGGFARFSTNGFSLGGGYLSSKLPGGSKLNAWTLGGSYKLDKLYLNLGYAENKLKLTQDKGTVSGLPMNQIVDLSVVSSLWAGQTNGGFQPGMVGQVGTGIAAINANKRKMIKVGVGYQLTPAVNIGAHYFHAKQMGSLGGAYDGKADFLVAAVDYAFSKRTDAYLGVDHTKLSGGSKMAIDAASGAKKRTGITIGIRHRF